MFTQWGKKMLIKIEEATKRLALYTLKIECFPPGLKFEGVVDEEKESLYLRLGLVKEKKLRPADFYWVGGKGYGRPVGIPSWVRVKVGKQFPKYLKAMTELLDSLPLESVLEMRYTEGKRSWRETNGTVCSQQ